MTHTPETEDDFICVGDVVEHRMNTNVFGIVIGMAGSLRYVRVSPSLAAMAFHEWELQLVDDYEDDDPLPAMENMPKAESNVINFTAAKKLRRDTKTEGAA